ncbi:MAG: hypothetical protein RLZ62_1679 [Bacteroidota bacterium]|jgi:hypothetical protein
MKTLQAVYALKKSAVTGKWRHDTLLPLVLILIIPYLCLKRFHPRAYNTVPSLIVQDRTITATEISSRLHISLSTAKRKLKELRDKEVIKREGSDKTGYWKVIG